MLPGYAGSQLMAAAASKSYLGNLTDAGQLSALSLVLDAGDASSWSGVGVQWSDLSGQGNHYAALASGLPAFNGQVGGRSANEYVSAGADGLCFGETTAQSFAESYHLNNALFSLFALLRVGPIADDGTTIFATATGSFASRGIIWRLSPATAGFTMSLWVTRGTSPVAYEVHLTSPEILPDGRWHAVGVSINEAAGSNGALFFVDGTVIGPQSATYASPATGAATSANAIWQTDTTSHLSGLFAWNRALSAANFSALYNALKTGRLGDLP
jgi:hypothetical protein